MNVFIARKSKNVCIIIKTIFFIIVIVSFSACSEDKNLVLYYEAEGYGYVYYKDTKEPISYARVYVDYIEEGNRWGSWGNTPQVYFADETGFFTINFLKRLKKTNVKEYRVSSYKNGSGYSQDIYIKASKIKKLKSNKLNLDTLWLEKKLF